METGGQAEEERLVNWDLGRELSFMETPMDSKTGEPLLAKPRLALAPAITRTFRHQPSPIPWRHVPVAPPLDHVQLTSPSPGIYSMASLRRRWQQRGTTCLILLVWPILNCLPVVGCTIRLLCFIRAGHYYSNHITCAAQHYQPG